MANSVLALASALARTFLVIGLGSAAALSGYLDRNAALGVGQLVAKVCLPALAANLTSALLRNGGLASGTSWELFFVRDVMVYGGGLVFFALFGLHETPRRRWAELWTAAVRRCQGPAELRSTEYARELYAEAVFEILPSIPRHLHEAPGERRNTY